MTPPVKKDPGPVSVEDNEAKPFDVYASLREEAGPDYWPISTLADFFGVNMSTLRAQTRAGHIPKPSKRAVQGHLSLQLYTHKDAVAIQEYYLKTGKKLKRTIDISASLGEQVW